MKEIQRIEDALQSQSGIPPLNLWQPPLSGDMDMVVKANGDWYHEGGKIKRPQLVKLFSRVLRRETDGEYYLVTPAEKWRIRVEDTPLLIVTMTIGSRADSRAESSQEITFTTNTDEQLVLGNQYPLTVSTVNNQPRPVVALNNGLTAKLSRNVFYQLVDAAEQHAGGYAVRSQGVWFSLE